MSMTLNAFNTSHIFIIYTSEYKHSLYTTECSSITYISKGQQQMKTGQIEPTDEEKNKLHLSICLSTPATTISPFSMKTANKN